MKGKTLADDPEGEVVAQKQTYCSHCSWLGQHLQSPPQALVAFHELIVAQAQQVDTEAGEEKGVQVLERLEEEVLSLKAIRLGLVE